MATMVSAAMFGALADFRAEYAPGKELWSAEPIISAAITNDDPQNRSDIVNYLLDEGSDPTWRRSRDGLTLVHAMISKFRHEVRDLDLALLVRLLDEGADLNAMMTKGGTALSVLCRQAVTYGEDHLGPLYDVVFARDDLDLFTVDRRGHSTYRLLWKTRSRLPELWSRVELYVADHQLVVPPGETQTV